MLASRKKFFNLFFLLTFFIISILTNSCTYAVSKKDRTGIIETNKGIIKFVLYEEKAPITTKNFIELAESHFYDGLTFHRYVPNFVIQGGDPDGNGTGGSGKTIPLEVRSDLTHEEGALGMARSNDPNSATSQFYISLAPIHQLDGNYAVFGKVTEGMDVVKKLRTRDKMLKVTIIGNSEEKK
jgi:peptidyl-prolyl cis-trans isomerase B (cyclophilin B)